MRLLPVDKKSLPLFKRLYFSAFPWREWKPLWLMRAGVRKGTVEMLAAEEAGFTGLAVTMLHGDAVLLDFLAVAPERRGTGAGAEILRLLRERYPGKRILLEIEPPDLPARNTEQRIRRKAFYERNGFRATGLKLVNYGNPLDVMATEGTPTCAEMRALIAHVHGPLVCALMHPHVRKGR